MNYLGSSKSLNAIHLFDKSNHNISLFNMFGEAGIFKSYSSTNLSMRSPPVEFIGCRVVRGPDWKWGKQDGYY